MDIYEITTAKIKQLPTSLLKEVNHYVDFLLLKSDEEKWQKWVHFSDAIDIDESDFSDYLRNLQEYEEQLAHGKIKW